MQNYESAIRALKKTIPGPLFRIFQPVYHWLLAFWGAVYYGFPSRGMKVVGVTGTSGKTTTVEMLHKIFSTSGRKTASLSGLYFRVKKDLRHNKLKMTMPGRFVIQKFLYEAKRAGCEYVFLEVTSEGIKQSRHKFIKFYAAIFTNLSPEHIESHGGFENYCMSKGKLFYASPMHVLNADDENFAFFNGIPAKEKIIFSARGGKSGFPQGLKLGILGDFNKENAAAALAFSRREGIAEEVAQKALAGFSLPGRMEYIETGKDFKVLVDYAFLPQTLEKVYEMLYANRSTLNASLICVLGAAGGGRDKWKRPVLGGVAAKYCREIIITNEDPYDEDPEKIMEEIETGINPSPLPPPLRKGRGNEGEGLSAFSVKKILDRRKAIREALKSAKAGDIVVITGKGAESWIMGPNGSKIPWDDREVVREEMQTYTL